jgi:hypothetical protein
MGYYHNFKRANTTSYRSSHNRRKGWFSKPTKPTRRVRHYSEALVLRQPVARRNKVAFNGGALLKKIKIFSIFSLFIFWFGLIFYLPYFKITTFNYTGLKLLKQEELQAAVSALLPASSTLAILPAKNNFFLVNTKKLEDKLNAQFSVNSIQVTKTFPNELTITVQEKNSSLIYDNGKEYYLLDQEGTAIKFLKEAEENELQVNNTNVPEFLASTAPNTRSTTTSDVPPEIHVPNYKKLNQEFGNYPIVYDLRNTNIKEKQTNILPATFINALNEWQNSLTKQGIVSVDYFTIENLTSGIKIKTNKPWDIYATSNNIPAQIEALKLIIKNNHPQEYIDLRYGEKVYWK